MKKTLLVFAALVAPRPLLAQTRSALYFFNAQPPLLAEFHGEVYRVPASDLQDVKGATTWKRFNSKAIPGSSLFLNTEKQYVVRHRFLWVLTQPPTRFSSNVLIDQDVVMGYPKRAALDMQRNLDVDRGSVLFDLAPDTKAALKIDVAEADAWQPATVETQKLSRQSGMTYCAWSLIDELTSEATTKTSVGAKDQDPTGAAVTTVATIQVVVKVYQDATPDPDGAIISGAVRSFSASPTGLAFGSPSQQKRTANCRGLRRATRENVVMLSWPSACTRTLCDQRLRRTPAM